MEDKNIDFNHLDLDLNKYQYDDIVGINIDEIADNSSIKNEPVLPDFEQSSALDILFNPDMEKKSDVDVATDAPMIFNDEVEHKKDDSDLWQNISFDELHFAPDDEPKTSKRNRKHLSIKQEKPEPKLEKNEAKTYKKEKHTKTNASHESKPETKEIKSVNLTENKFAVNADLFNEIKAKQKIIPPKASQNENPSPSSNVAAKDQKETISYNNPLKEKTFEGVELTNTNESRLPQNPNMHEAKVQPDKKSVSSAKCDVQNDLADQMPKKSKPQIIEDYSSDGEREDVLVDLKATLKKITAKSIWMAFLLIISIYLTVGTISRFQFIFPDFLHPIHSAKIYSIVWLSLTGLVFLCNFSPLISGLKKVFRAKVSTDGMLFFLGLSLITLDTYYVLNQDAFKSHLIHFDFLFILGILMNLLAKKKLVRSICKNFQMISTDQTKTIVCGPTNLPINNDIMMETGNGGDVIYLERTKIISNYLRRSFGELEQPKLIQTLLFLVTVICLATAGTLYFTHKFSLVEALLLLASALALSAPAFSSLAYSAVVYRITAILRSVNSMITGTYGAKVLSDSGILVTTDDDLISGLDVKLLSMQLRNDCDPSELLIDMSALFRTVGKALGDLFYNVLDKKSAIQLPKVDDIFCYDRLGYTAVINGKKIAVGNAEFMKRLSVSLFDEKHSDTESYIYVSLDGVLTGIFTVKYELSSVTKNAISILDRQGYSLAVVATDFNLNEKMFYDADLEHPDMVTILSFTTAKECKNLCSERKIAPAEIISFDGVRGVASGISAGNKLLLCRILQNCFSVTASIFGLFAAIALSLLCDSMSFWLPFIAVIYQILWGIPAFVIARCCKL